MRSTGDAGGEEVLRFRAWQHLEESGMCNLRHSCGDCLDVAVVLHPDLENGAWTHGACACVEMATAGFRLEDPLVW